MFPFAYKTRAFTVIELLVVMMVLAIIAGFSVPLFRSMLIRNDLYLAVQQIEQMLSAAQIRSQAGSQGSSWGLYVPDGILYKGENFAFRDQDFDEIFSYNSTISSVGIQDVSFSRIYGVASQTGTIILESTMGERKEVNIPIVLGPVSEPEPLEEEENNVYVNVSYERIDNSGNGDALALTYVGPDAEKYVDSEWIELRIEGTTLIDSGLSVGQPGLAIERGQGSIRVYAHGDHPWWHWWSKEVVDARITFNGAVISDIQNDPSVPTESPFDGNVNDSAAGDEVTTHPDNTSTLYQTRVTSNSDALIIFWE